jgi:hypothetical protein
MDWGDVSGAAGYVVRMNKDPQGDWFNGAGGDQWHEPGTSFQSASIDPNSNYTWYVQPKAPGESYPYAAPSCAGPPFNCSPSLPCLAPPPLTISEPTCDSGTNNGTFNVSWPNFGVSGYVWQLATDPGFAPADIVYSGIEVGTSRNFTGLPADTYYFRLRNDEGADCQWITRTVVVPSCPSTCDIDLNPVLSPDFFIKGGTVQVRLGEYQDFATRFSAEPPNIEPSSVQYTLTGSPIIDLSDNNPPGPSFFTTATPTGGIGIGVTLTATGYIGGVPECTDYTVIQVNNALSWWQVEDADVWSSGVINSSVPVGQGEYFDKVASYTPGFPGVPVFGASTDIPEAYISAAPYQWRANSSTIYSTDTNKQFDYAYFEENLPNEVGTALAGGNITNPSITFSYFNNNDGYEYEGYYFFKRVGDLTLSNGGTLNSGRKVILFVEGGAITFEDGGNGGYSILSPSYGNTLFMVISTGDMILDQNTVNNQEEINRLDGIFVTDGTFETGPGSPDSEGLVVNGSVVAWNGVDLQRELPNNFNNPAELFRYRPQMLLTIPPFFGLQTMKWREVAP